MPRPARQPNKEYRLEAIAAARLRSLGFTQSQIAQRIGRSQPEVSRLIAFAQKENYLARWPGFLRHKVSADDLQEVDRRYFVSQDLSRKLRLRAPQGWHLEVRVMPDGDDAFSNAAARSLADLLGRARIIGILWGRSVQRAVSQLPGCLDAAASEVAQPPQVIPLCGDPVHLMNLGQVPYSASSLAADLGKAINPENHSDQPCLVGVPAYLPRFFFENPNIAAAWQDFLQGIPGYREIFCQGNGAQLPWVERVDTIISGTGIIVADGTPPNRRMPPPGSAAYLKTGDFILERIIQEDGLTEAELARLVHGDIGGWLVARRNLDAPSQRLVQSLNAGWTGLNDTHLARVARAAKPNGAPGVIVLAAGAAKADMILEIVRLGLVNELLIDATLAAALGDFLPEPPNPPGAHLRPGTEGGGMQSGPGGRGAPGRG
ncbi:MAG TPA: hypothetical protein P5233_05230 [Candidatus Paceibacterota bacterium]|nr:hypothetical protein [Candidatus Paceibacterota bacterium]